MNEISKLQMTKEGAFSVSFCGQGVEAGTINARDLSEALSGLSDVVEEINKVVTRGEARIELHARASPRQGSFEIDLQLVQNLYEKFVDLFSSDHVIAWATFLSMLGMSGFGLIQLVKRTKGMKPKRVVEIEETHKYRITYDDDEIEVEGGLWKLSKRGKVRLGLARFVKPLGREGIERIALNQPSSEPVTIEKSEKSYFDARTEHEGERISESERVLKLLSVSFKEGNKWRVSEGTSSFYVTISDEEYYEDVKSGVERFSANDHLRVLLQTHQWKENGELKASYEIVKILKHYTGDDFEFLELSE